MPDRRGVARTVVRGPHTVREVLKDLVEALKVLDRLRVPWANTRFDRYVRVLREAAEKGKPPDPPENVLYEEAVLQGGQLGAAMTLALVVDEQVFAAKLRDVVKGADLAPEEPTRDHPRNTLFELMAGALLASYGCRVQLTLDDEDLGVSHPRMSERFFVECKRPAVNDVATVDRNLKEANRQARTRLLAKPRHVPIVVLGVDRIYGTARKLVSAPTEATLVEAVRNALTMGVNHVRSRLAALKLRPGFTVGALVFIGLGHATEEDVLYQMRLLRFWTSRGRLFGKQLARVLGDDAGTVG